MRRVNKDQKVRVSITLNGRKMSAETCWAEIFLPRTSTQASPLSAATME